MSEPLTAFARVDTGEHVLAMAWSPAGDALATAGVDGGVFLYTPDGQNTAPQRIAQHSGGALSVTWSPDGSRVASSGQDGRVRVHARNGQEIGVLDVGERWVGQIAFSPDGKRLAAAGRSIALWQAANLALLHRYPPGPGTIEALAFSPNGRVLAAAGYGGVRLLTPYAPPRERLLAWSGACLAAAWRPKGDVIAIGGQDASVQFWRLPQGNRAAMSGFDGKVRQLAWSRSGRWLATGGSAVVAMWDFKRGPEGTAARQGYGHVDRISGIAWQHRGDRLASIGIDGRLLLWHPDRQDHPLADHDLIFIPTTVAFSPDDRWLATGGDSGELSVFEVANARH